jgi:simple sugar transport system substrate-binding protein
MKELANIVKHLLPFILITVIVLCSVLALAACTRNGKTGADSVSAATARKGPPVPTLLERFMPDAMADGMIKIAVLVNLNQGDNASQFIDGCVTEGQSMGFIVDAFVSSGDESRCREIAAGIAAGKAAAAYDGLIFSNGFASGIFGDFSYDILKPIADTGTHIVTLEALPYHDGQSIKGLITTFQDDYRLARLSLETLLSSVIGGEDRAARVIRIGCDPGITFLDRRAWEFEQMVNGGTIQEAAFVRLDGLENPHGAAWEALAAILPRFPPGSVDALWVPWDEFAGGCAEALAAAGRQDIKMVSIGISNDDMRLMQRHAGLWLANTAVDPKLAGTINMRILAARLAGEALPDTFSFTPQLVHTTDLNRAVNMANIATLVPGWGEGEGLFDHYQWMNDLKESEMKHLRVDPAASKMPVSSLAPISGQPR